MSETDHKSKRYWKTREDVARCISNHLGQASQKLEWAIDKFRGRHGFGTEIAELSLLADKISEMQDKLLDRYPEMYDG